MDVFVIHSLAPSLRFSKKILSNKKYMFVLVIDLKQCVTLDEKIVLQ